MKSINSFMRLLFIALILFSCAGKDGDPGPEGPAGPAGAQGEKGNEGKTGKDGGLAKDGSISGNLSGTMADGTAYDEDFKFEYAYDKVESFTDNSTFEEPKYSLYLLRVDDASGDGSGMELSFSVSNKEDGSDITLDYLRMVYTKELSASNLFAFQTELQDDMFEPLQVVYPVAKAISGDYGLDLSKLYSFYNGVVTYRPRDYQTDNYMYYPLQNGGKVWFATTGNIDGDGEHYEIEDIRDANGESLEDFGAFTDHTLLKASDAAQTYRFLDGDGNDLSETVDADVAYEITNYSYDSTTGSVKFHYSITIPGGINSTTNDATIEGDVSVTIYDSIHGRQGAQ